MSGEELKKKLESAGISQAEIARRLGVIPQSVGQSLAAKDIKTSFLEELCRAFDKDMSFFYGGPALSSSVFSSRDDEISKLRKQIEYLLSENNSLREELKLKEDPDHPRKESEVYRLWMEHMKITERMQELYQKQKEE